MDTERRCLYCTRVIDPNLGRKDRKYCDKSCKDSYWYRIKYKKYYDEKYKRLKREWSESPNGRRAGVSFREWRYLPPEWK